MSAVGGEAEKICSLCALPGQPLTARAQQLALPVIGVPGSGSRTSFELALSAFVEGVAQV
jgi:hypothetical protein